jgi:hypothetical protein
MTSSLKTAKRAEHAALADTLRRRVLEGTGETSSVLRQTVAASATGGLPAPPPYDELARQIGEAAYRTADETVANVLRATGTEKAAFDVTFAAAVGAVCSAGAAPSRC